MAEKSFSGKSGKKEKFVIPGPHVIYMDAGVWNSSEEGMPTMTFGLMEHNAIALCKYFSDGTRIPLPIEPAIGYDFYKTQIFAFLTRMMEKKYPDMKFIGNRNPWMGCHVLKIFPFPAKSLLDDESELRILVPDLHLHFFKGTYLDNFITYYRNISDDTGIRTVKTGKRMSMETDFGLFLETIADFQKDFPKTFIHFLGDTCELWETESIMRYYRSDDEAKKIYASLDDLGQWVLENLEKSPQANSDPKFRKLKSYVKQLTQTKLVDIPLKPEIKKQLDAAFKNVDRKRFLFEGGEDSDTVVTRAQGIRSEILNKHHGPNRKTFTELLDAFSWKYWINGNHDNYLGGINDANNTFAFSPPELRASRFRNQYTFKNCAFLYNHGHNMDFFNNDDACALGRIITCLLAFYELKGRGDLVKKFEGIFRSDEDVRLDYVKKIARLCYLWEQDTPDFKKKNKVIVLAHTHIPDLKDMTGEAVIWKLAEGLLGKPKDQTKIIKKLF